ncbi:MAG: PEP-utilizing enzyme [Patescibacteria group bacterium]|jgi:phosphohistidine swiveling domain-containing protein
MKFDNFEIYERIYSSHWFLTSYNGIGFIFDFPKIGGGNFLKKVIYVMENQMCRYIFNHKEFELAANYTADKLINNNKWRKEVYEKIDYFTKQYFDAGENLRDSNLSLLSNKELIKRIRRIIVFQHYHQVYSVLANGVVLDGRNHMSNKIRDELRNNLNFPPKFENYWSTLTQITRMSLRQKKDYEISLLAKKVGILTQKQIESKLKKLHKEYCWLDYNNMGPATSFDAFRQQLKMAKRSDKDLNVPKRLAVLKKKQRQLMSTLKFNRRSRFLIALAQQVIWQKGYRKDVQYHGFYCYEPLLQELVRRKKVSDWQTLSFLFPWELEGYIKSNKPTTAELEQRRKLSVFMVTRAGHSIMVGKKAKMTVKKFGSLENFTSVTEVRGQVAYTGLVRGKVKIIQTPSDMVKMNKGDVLMSQATSPDLLPAMKKAGAIVTNTGGLICHAAITSRELKIPCVVGTAKATLVFKDGDLVEVDATSGVVKIVKSE